ncbi:MAG: hypothetical protein ACK5LX_16560 [Oscillospiraceae bacterium]
MDRRTQTHQSQTGPHFPPGSGPSCDPCHGTPPSGGKVVELGRILVRTVRHFWPGFNGWLQALPDSRFQPYVTYDRRFLMWWGLLLFCCKLGSRRQLDFHLRDPETHILPNVNSLADTFQESLPVNKTLDHFLSHVGSEALDELRTRCVRRLIRNKVLDACRLHGQFVLVFDGTGFLSFHQRHCPHCLHHRNVSSDTFLHPVLEAKIVDPSGLAISLDSEFIENASSETCEAEIEGTLSSYEKVKQDCELAAFLRLAPRIKAAFPQTRFCVAADALMACGAVMTLCEQYRWSYVLTFKPGRAPALWQEFQALLTLSPQNRLRQTLGDGTVQVFRWMNDIPYTDSNQRSHILSGLLCQETDPQGEAHTFSWITEKHLHAGNVSNIATRAGRSRFIIENQGFNTQKNGGLNLEHAYSTGEDTLKSFYLLLQISHQIRLDTS